MCSKEGSNQVNSWRWMEAMDRINADPNCTTSWLDMIWLDRMEGFSFESMTSLYSQSFFLYIQKFTRFLHLTNNPNQSLTLPTEL